ncbi:hypothetical protein OAI00_04095 [Euryarchaeota archaeon]|nr:hypothetical protein [Euryarchaeota archaeon]
MSSKGLGRGLKSVSALAKDGPDLSSYVSLDDKNPIDSPRIAVLWMIFGSICFGTMNALVKWTSVNADVWMIIFIRSLVIALAVIIFARFRGTSLKMNDPKKNVFTLFGWINCYDIIFFSSIFNPYRTGSNITIYSSIICCSFIR